MDVQLWPNRDVHMSLIRTDDYYMDVAYVDVAYVDVANMDVAYIADFWNFRVLYH